MSHKSCGSSAADPPGIIDGKYEITKPRSGLKVTWSFESLCVYTRASRIKSAKAKAKPHYRQTDRQTDTHRQADRQKGRKTDRQTDTQAGKHVGSVLTQPTSMRPFQAILHRTISSSKSLLARAHDSASSKGGRSVIVSGIISEGRVYWPGPTTAPRRREARVISKKESQSVQVKKLTEIIDINSIS